jgi:[NiFe] hydrogenase assembly HybE family chaperone
MTESLVEISRTLEAVFERIHQERMQGIPLLNPELKVETVGFQSWQGRTVGVLITPWLMSLVLLAGEEDDWSGLELGQKQLFDFPSQPHEFTVNEFEGFGICQTVALHSPMSKFPSHTSAVETARAFMESLMEECEREEVAVDKARMERYLNGEDMAQIYEDEKQKEIEQQQAAELQPQVLSRRDLLRGVFSKQG